ncbi:uncharacterized protein LOC144151913 [Haemaphysalis longicornis]
MVASRAWTLDEQFFKLNGPRSLLLPARNLLKGLSCASARYLKDKCVPSWFGVAVSDGGGIMYSVNRTWAGLPPLVMLLLLLLLADEGGTRTMEPRERHETVTHEERTTHGRGSDGDMMEDDMDRPSTTVTSSTRRRVVIPGEDDYQTQQRRGGRRLPRDIVFAALPLEHVLFAQPFLL